MPARRRRLSAEWAGYPLFMFCGNDNLGGNHIG